MLPYDYARCMGHIYTMPGVMGTLTMGQAECVRCLRRTEPGNPDGPQSHIKPPEFVDGKCPSRIGPEDYQ